MKRKTVFWILLFGTLAVLSGGIYLLHGSVGRRAEIYVDGELYETVDLAAVAAPYTFTVETEYGWNAVRVARGEIAVVDADCPNRDCVKQGAVSDGAVPIVCLPHRLVIQIEE